MDNDAPPQHHVPPVLRPSGSNYGTPPRRNRWWPFLAIVLGFLFLGVMALNFLGLMRGFPGFERAGGQSGQWLEEVVVENNRSNNKIAIIDVDGLITSQAWDRSGKNMVDLIEDQLKMAAQDAAVKAVILKVDSPGGEVMASDDISRSILDFQVKHGKSVVAVMGGLAASGGYYVSAPCQWIVANELTITGSIGVIMNSFNYRGLMDKVGLQPLVFKSGRFKDMLSGSKRPEDVSAAEKEMIQAMVDETFLKFKSVVRQGRQRAIEKNGTAGRALAPNWEEYADGRVLTGTQAFTYGFVDELGNFDTAVARARKLENIADANLVRYQEPFNLASMFSLFGKSEGNVIKVDLGIDFPKLQTGRPYFLSPTVVH